MGSPLPSILRAENDLLFDEQGRSYTDLFSGHGVAWLGHANPAITARIVEQLGRVWTCPGLPHPAGAEARECIESFFPQSHGLACLYSTGMEAAEFAMRMARVATGRSGCAGFERSMHGKSLATATLGWDNTSAAPIESFWRLPFPPNASEDESLGALRAALKSGRVGSLFIEPIQASSGGFAASDAFYVEAARLCRQHGALLVFDEMLTGFHRTGPPFGFSALGIVPDVILIGKALGNGFPVSAVVADRQYPIAREMLPSSTYAGNPLAAAAVAATLREMRAIDLPSRVAAIETTVCRVFAPLLELGIPLRGRGALWVLTLPPDRDCVALALRLFARGVAVGPTAAHLRLLPPATIDPARLEKACTIVAEEVMRLFVPSDSP